MKNKLLNISFPLWFLLIFPATWLIALPINFLIDSIVLLCGFRLFKVVRRKENYKKSILKVWGVGFLADIIGSIILLVTQFFPSDGILGDIVKAVVWNPFSNIAGFLFVLFAFLVSTFLIYIVNDRFSFKKLEIEDKVKTKIALILAIFTAPYLFFYPSSRIYENDEEYTLNQTDQKIICEYIEID